MNNKEMIMFLATARSKDLKEYLKSKSIKGVYKLKKRELLEVAYDTMFLEENQVVFGLEAPEVKQATSEEVVYDNITEMINKYKKEIHVRTGIDTSSEDILLDLLTHNKVKFKEFRQYVIDNELNLALGKDISETYDINWSDHGSVLNQYNQNTSKSYFDVLPIETLTIESTREYSECIKESGNYAIALDYTEDNPVITVYFNCRLIGCYEIPVKTNESNNRVIYENIEKFENNILELAEYDNLDKFTLRDLYITFTEECKEYVLENNRKNVEKTEKEWKEKIEDDLKYAYNKIYNNWNEIKDFDKYYDGLVAHDWGERIGKHTFRYYSEQEREAKKQAKERTYQRSYRESHNHNSYNSFAKSNSHTEEEIGYFKKIYRVCSKQFHPDMPNGDEGLMKWLNSLKAKYEV